MRFQDNLIAIQHWMEHSIGTYLFHYVGCMGACMDHLLMIMTWRPTSMCIKCITLNSVTIRIYRVDNTHFVQTSSHKVRKMYYTGKKVYKWNYYVMPYYYLLLLLLNRRTGTWLLLPSEKNLLGLPRLLWVKSFLCNICLLPTTPTWL